MHHTLIATAALAALLTGTQAEAAKACKVKEPPRERCYGIAKGGRNDCAAKDGRNACAGLAHADNDPANWIYVPKGLCSKIAGGVRRDIPK